MKHKITFLPDNAIIEMEHNGSLFKAAKAAGVYVLSSCGGKGNCGKCKLIVKSGTVEPGKSRSFLSTEEAARGYILACHSHVLSDLTIEIPHESRMQAKHKIATGANTDALFKLLREAGVPLFVGGLTSVRRRDALVAAGAQPLGVDIAAGLRHIGAVLGPKLRGADRKKHD